MYGKECRWLRECWWCVQIAQTVLSGSKGLMLFQTYHEAISRTNMSLVRKTIHAMRTVSEAIRTGDIGGVGFTVSSKLNEEVMVETILSPTQLLVTVINIDAKGYSNLLCHGNCSTSFASSSEASKEAVCTVGVEKHWKWSKHTIGSLTLDLHSAPQLRSVSNWREVVGDELRAPTAVRIGGSGRAVTLSQIEMDDEMVARFFVADVSLH